MTDALRLATLRLIQETIHKPESMGEEEMGYINIVELIRNGAELD